MAAFSCAPNLGGHQAAHRPFLACTRRGSPFQRFPPLRSTNRSCHGWRRAVPFLCHGRGSRHPHVGAAASLVGGGTFLSGSEEPPSAALSLSHEYGSPPYLFLLKVPAAGKGGQAPFTIISVAPPCISHEGAHRGGGYRRPLPCTAGPGGLGEAREVLPPAPPAGLFREEGGLCHSDRGRGSPGMHRSPVPGDGPQGGDFGGGGLRGPPGPPVPARGAGGSPPDPRGGHGPLGARTDGRITGRPGELRPGRGPRPHRPGDGEERPPPPAGGYRVPLDRLRIPGA